MLLGELWWAQSAGAIPGNPLRAFVSVAVAMFLDASGFHAGSFAPALSSRKVHPVYRLLSMQIGAMTLLQICRSPPRWQKKHAVLLATGNGPLEHDMAPKQMTF